MASSKRQMAAPRNLDEEMRQLLVEIRMLEGSARVLSSRLDIVTGALSETQTAKQTLEGTKESGKNVEMLIPIGSGSFVKAKLEDPQHVRSRAHDHEPHVLAEAAVDADEHT